MIGEEAGLNVALRVQLLSGWIDIIKFVSHFLRHKLSEIISFGEWVQTRVIVFLHNTLLTCLTSLREIPENRKPAEAGSALDLPRTRFGARRDGGRTRGPGGPA